MMKALGWIGVGVVVGSLGMGSYQTYKWKQNVDQRGYVAEQAAKYLFAPTEIIDDKGQHLRRIDVLDRIMATAVKVQK